MNCKTFVAIKDLVGRRLSLRSGQQKTQQSLEIGLSAAIDQIAGTGLRRPCRKDLAEGGRNSVAPPAA